jgi:cytochrome c556
MVLKNTKARVVLALGALALGGAVVAHAQAPAPGAGRKAVDERKAVYTLVGASFRPLGAILKGDVPYAAAEVNKRLSRLAVLAPYTTEVFPDASNLGEPDTKAKPEVWSKRADFDAKQKEFVADVAALVAANAKDQAFSDTVKTALGKAAEDCKGCHDDFKLK